MADDHKEAPGTDSTPPPANGQNVTDGPTPKKTLTPPVTPSLEKSPTGHSR